MKCRLLKEREARFKEVRCASTALRLAALDDAGRPRRTQRPIEKRETTSEENKRKERARNREKQRDRERKERNQSEREEERLPENILQNTTKMK